MQQIWNIKFKPFRNMKASKHNFTIISFNKKDKCTESHIVLQSSGQKIFQSMHNLACFTWRKPLALYHAGFKICSCCGWLQLMHPSTLCPVRMGGEGHHGIGWRLSSETQIWSQILGIRFQFKFLQLGKVFISKLPTRPRISSHLK